jgi:KipI family sensor histidine kinase inhibitor
VAVGAHPGYPDRANFGRIPMDVSDDELARTVCSQIKTLQAVAEAEAVALRHVKLHGALYNDLIDDYERSLSLCRRIAALDPALRFIGFSGSAMLRAAEDAGLTAVHEVFADRAYTDAGRLVPRSEPGAVIHDASASLAQVEMMVLQQKVPTAADRLLPIQADSVCVHGDTPSAVEFVAGLQRFFERQQIEIRPGGEHCFSFARLGEEALLARLPARICRSTHRVIRSLHHALQREGIEGIREFVPCYSELKIDFDPAVIQAAELQDRVVALSVKLDAVELPPSRLVEVPVCYEGAYAPDLAQVASHAGLAEHEVIQRHSAQTCLVYMLGFSPGFAYLGGLDPKLATPRLDTPRVSVPAGAVGIAGNQTGIYPLQSPGGWNLIGRTPLKLFDPGAEKPFLFEPGDEVRFVPVSGKEFNRMKGGGTASPLSANTGGSAPRGRAA